jgi:CRP-like cAMP-binding protein
MDDEALLGSSELFLSLGADSVATLVSASKRVRFNRNQMVFAEGEEAHELYVVRSGKVAIAKQSPDHRESLIALMDPGDLFGEMALFDHEPRSAGARALESSELLSVPYPPILALAEARPELLWDVVSMLARRLRSTDAALADSVFLDVTGRTAKRLLELAGDADEFQLPITQEELAGMVGASRERVNKAIAAFVKLRWIELSDRRYRITDRKQLTQRSR